MSSLIDNQNTILALEAEIVELKQKLTGLEAEMVAFKAELKAEGKSASEILVLLSEMTRNLSEMTRLLSEDKHQLNLLLEEKLRREQQASAGRNIKFHSYLFYLCPARFNLFPFLYLTMTVYDLSPNCVDFMGGKCVFFFSFF